MLVALLGGFFDGLVAELMVFLLVLSLLTLDTENAQAQEAPSADV